MNTVDNLLSHTLGDTEFLNKFLLEYLFFSIKIVSIHLEYIELKLAKR